MNQFKDNDQSKALVDVLFKAQEALKSLEVFCRSTYPADANDTARFEALSDAIEDAKKLGLGV